jgi:hypothetical protein
MIWLEKQLLVRLLLLLHRMPLVVRQRLALLTARPVVADHREIDRKMVSSDTTMVSSPNR